MQPALSLRAKYVRTGCIAVPGQNIPDRLLVRGLRYNFRGIFNRTPGQGCRVVSAYGRVRRVITGPAAARGELTGAQLEGFLRHWRPSSDTRTDF